MSALASAGDWQITISLAGADTVNATTSNGLAVQSYGAITTPGVLPGFPAATWSTYSGGGNANFGLSTLQPAQAMKEVSLYGTVATNTDCNITAEVYLGSNNAITGQIQHQLSNGKIIVGFQWVPAQGCSMTTDPPPAWLCFAAGSSETASAGTSLECRGPGNTASASAAITIGNAGATASSSQSSPMSAANNMGQLSQTNTNPLEGVALALIQVNPAGYAQYQVPLTWQMTGNIAGSTGADHGAGAGVNFEYFVEECPLSDWFGGVGPILGLPTTDRIDADAISGEIVGHGKDPTFTRALPMQFTPAVNSTPFRNASGALPAPWGNVNCAYSICMQDDPNFDLFGYGIVANSQGAVYANTGQLVPKYAIIDASGNKLTLFAGFVPEADVRGTFAQLPGGGFQLSNAGPPDHIKGRGLFTYTFGSIVNGVAPLLSIQDPFGNIQTLTYGSGTRFLTVQDATSGRQLWFTSGTNGYLSEVDAPNIGLSSPYTKTLTSFDSGGHMTAVGVFAAGSNAPVRTDSYTYAGDTIVASALGGVQDSFSYIGGFAQEYGQALQRVNQMTEGVLTDTTSSDDGASIQGLYTFGYGWLGSAEIWSNALYTITQADPLGNQLSTGIFLTGGQTGPVNQINYLGPTYTGAAVGSNSWSTLYAPSVVAPSTVTITDPLLSNWIMHLDPFGNLVQTQDALGHQWSATFSSDGLSILSTTDPLNHTWSLNYGQNGAPPDKATSVTDPSGTVQVQASYNPFGQVTQYSVPAATSSSGTVENRTFAYDASTGDLSSATNALGQTTTLDLYDPFGDPGRITTYPDTGNPLTSTSPLATTFLYDATQMPTSATLPNGLTASLAYSSGQPVSVIVEN